jgi:hypothetical protein
VAKRSGDTALDVSSSWSISPAAQQSKAVWRYRFPPHSRFVPWSAVAKRSGDTALDGFIVVAHPSGSAAIQSGVALSLPAALQVCHLECGGKAKRRHRLGCFIVVEHQSGNKESKAVWRYRFSPHSMFVPWSAVAKRSGDTGLDGFIVVAHPSGSGGINHAS